MAHKAATINKMEQQTDTYAIDNWVCVIWNIEPCVDVRIVVEHFVDHGFVGNVAITAPKRDDEFEREGIKLTNLQTMQQALDNLVSKVLKFKGIELESPIL